MSFITVTGVLTNPSGAVLPNYNILFEAIRTSDTVINNTDVLIVTNSSGGYSFELGYGTYTLKIKSGREARYSTVASNIMVYSQTLDNNNIQQILLAQEGLGDINIKLIDQFLQIRADVLLNAQNASTSETNAAASAASALTSKNAAATSATSASSSAASALASKNAAATSETNAASSASSALTSKNAAATSETNALTSKNAAATSATNAATSAAGASTSASNAAASATLAGNYAAVLASVSTAPPYTPTVNASLDLDFAKQKYKWYAGSAGITESNSMTPLITFTRSSIATYFDAMGVMRQAANDIPRIDYYPLTGECRGLLVEEQRTNLFPYSAYPASASAAQGWNRINCAVYPNVAVAPNGTMTAAKAVVSVGAATTGNDGVGVFATPGVTSSATHTLTLYVKDAGAGYLRIRESITTGQIAKVNLTTGAITAEAGYTTTTFTVAITNVGNGWWRVAVVRTPTTTFGFNLKPGIDVGDGVSGIYVWGAQIEAGAFPTSYIPTHATFTGRASTKTYFDSNGVMQTAANDVAVTDYDYVYGQWVSKGLSLEPQATNLLTYSSDLSNDSWSKSNSVTISGRTISFVDAMSRVVKSVTPADGIYTLSARFSLADVGKKIRLAVWYTGKDGFYYADSTIPESGVVITTVNATGITNVGIINSSAGTAQSVTLYPGTGIQFEAGPVATSYIPTTTAQVTRAADTSTSAQVTRAADSVVISGTNFSQWFKQYEGTVTAESINPTTYMNDSVGYGRGVAVFSDNSDSNRIRFGSSAGVTFVVTKGGIEQSSQTIGAVTIGVHKFALSFVTNSVNAEIDAVSASTDTSATIPYLTQLNIGKGAIAGGVWGGHIRSLKYYPKALASAELQAMTV